MNKSTKFLLASIAPVALAAGWAMLDSSPAYSSVRQAAPITESQGNTQGFFLSDYRVTSRSVSFPPMLDQSIKEAVLRPSANTSPRDDITYVWLVFVDIDATGRFALKMSARVGGTIAMAEFATTMLMTGPDSHV